MSGAVGRSPKSTVIRAEINDAKATDKQLPMSIFLFMREINQ